MKILGPFGKNVLAGQVMDYSETFKHEAVCVQEVESITIKSTTSTTTKTTSKPGKSKNTES